MKKLFFSVIVVLLLTAQGFAQSDYEIKQSFLSKHKSIELAIDKAQSTSELEVVKSSVEGLESEYTKHQQLLDKALYPDNFSGSIAKLRKKIEVADARIAKSEKLEGETQDLKTKVDSLSTEVADLRKKSDELISENFDLKKSLQSLKYQMQQSQVSAAQWQGATVKYKDNIRKRDELITKMVSSIFDPIGKDFKKLEDKEKKQVTLKIESLDVLDNVKNLINDHIALVDLGSFKPDDFSELRKFKSEFSEKWLDLAPKMEDVYGDSKTNMNKIREIEVLLNSWDYAINRRIWNGIYLIFAEHNIKIKRFDSAEKMVDNIKAYVDSMMALPKSANRDSLLAKFKTLRDTVWNDEFIDKWYPLLKKQNMMTSEQRDDIKTVIKAWEKQLGAGTPIWLYAVVGGVAVAVIIIVIVIFMKKKKTPPPPPAPTVTA